VKAPVPEDDGLGSTDPSPVIRLSNMVEVQVRQACFVQQYGSTRNPWKFFSLWKAEQGKGGVAPLRDMGQETCAFVGFSRGVQLTRVYAGCAIVGFTHGVQLTRVRRC